jgi:hypothetical protein
MNEHKAHQIHKIGPGGAKCRCCTCLPSVKDNKAYLNRLARRGMKKALKKELAG